ncbi:MAG TPA: inositol monophosphatase [Actinomycetota bacterium]|nr:inositol monophosphatase [Actinomycetota bacterium]
MGDIEERLAWAEAIAAEVGGTLTGAARAGLTAQAKGDKGIVTELDVQAEARIAGSLAAAFPDDGLESEEGTRRAGSGRYRWVVDPLDGTTNFVAGLPMYAVSLACLDVAGAALGVVHAPALGETFRAARRTPPAAPAMPPAALSAPAGLKQAVFIVNKAYRPAPVLWAVAGALMSSVRAFRTFGCVSLDLALVAAGRADGLVLLPAEPWDVAAGLLLAAEAGLATGDLGGQPDPDGRAGVLVTHPALFESAAVLLNAPALNAPALRTDR